MRARRKQWLLRAGSFAGSVLLHGAFALALASAPGRELGRSAVVEMEVIEQVKPPPPKPPPEPPREPERPKPPPVKPRSISQPKVAPPPPDQPPPPSPPPDAPPPPNRPPPAEAPKTPVRIMTGISLSSTTTAGSFALPVGNTLYGKMPEVAPSPEAVKPYSAPVYVPPVEVTELPELVAPPPVDRVKDYPQRARVEGVEAICNVLLRVGPDGKVEKTLKAECSEPGYEFEEKARLIALRARFKPGRRGGEPVSTDITYKFRFELE